MLNKPSIIVISGIDQARKGLAKAVCEKLGGIATLGQPLKEEGFAKSVSYEVGRRRTVGDGAACAALMAAFLHYAEHKLGPKASPGSPFILNRWCEFVRARHIDLPAQMHASGLDEDRLDSFNALVRQIESRIEGEVMYLYARVKPNEIRASEPTQPETEYGDRIFWSRKADQERAIANSLETYFLKLRATKPEKVEFFKGTRSFDDLRDRMTGFIRIII